jgi:LysR family nitrogen assimilation transcriptional regulator
MELKQLKYFTRVADLGGFSKAALSLSISQPALSKKLRQLELELNRDLLIRNGRGVSLTHEGLIFLEHARIMLDQAERAKQELEGTSTSPSGKVILACASNVGAQTIAALFTAFHKKFPSASMEIIEIKGWTVYDWLLHGRADIGLLYEAQPISTIKIIPLRSSELCLISPKGKTHAQGSKNIPWSALKNHQLIFPGNPRAIKPSLKQISEDVTTALNSAYEIEGTDTILELVRQGHGHTILPKEMIMEHELATQLMITPLAKPKVTSTLAIAVPDKRRLTQLCEQTIKMIKDQLGKK